MATSVGVGMLTYNFISTGREEDFWRTWISIHDGDYDAEFVLLTNGSSDGTETQVRKLGGVVDNGDDRIWYGNTKLIHHLKGNDLIVLTADDLEYQEGWLRRLVSFMDNAPDDIALVSCYLEPLWAWNRPLETVEYGGEKALVRESVCGSSWVFRSKDWYDWMGPFEKVMPGEDLLICKRIRERGMKMAALDLCEHIGEGRSAWGNQSHMYAQPLDREQWGI